MRTSKHNEDLETIQNHLQQHYQVESGQLEHMVLQAKLLMAKKMIQLQTATETDDPDAITKALHDIRDVLSGVGHGELSEITQVIEHHVITDSPDEYKLLIKNLRTRLEMILN